MDAPTRAPGYDLFKLIVAVFLLILALILMWISPSQTPTSFLITPSAAPTAHASPTEGSASPTSPLPTATTSPISHATSPPLTVTLSPIPPPTGTPVAMPTPTPTVTPAPEATATPGIGASEAAACNAVLARSQLKIGNIAVILRRLNFRSSPGIRENWLLTNLPGIQVKVIGGPECVPYWTGAYLWWQIQLSNGRVGWSAEASLHGSFYFMEPK